MDSENETLLEIPLPVVPRPCGMEPTVVWRRRLADALRDRHYHSAALYTEMLMRAVLQEKHK